MKKLIPFLALACITVVSCHHGRDLNITSIDGDHYFSMYAHFSKSKTRALERFMDYRIGALTNMSFINSRIDGQLALDDHTTFYLKKYPGYIKIKIDKDENSWEAYERIRSMCEGMKEVLTR